MSELRKRQEQIVKRLIALEVATKLDNKQGMADTIGWFKQTFGRNWKMDVISYVAQLLKDRNSME